MALTAVLEFGDNNIRRYSKQFMVADCRFVFDRSYNDFCPEGDTRCERMELFVVAPGKEDLTLFEWFADQSVLDGRITISLGATRPVTAVLTLRKSISRTRYALRSPRYMILNLPSAGC